VCARHFKCNTAPYRPEPLIAVAYGCASGLPGLSSCRSGQGVSKLRVVRFLLHLLLTFATTMVVWTVAFRAEAYQVMQAAATPAMHLCAPDHQEASRIEAAHLSSVLATLDEDLPSADVAAECDNRGASRVSEAPMRPRSETSITGNGTPELIQDTPPLTLSGACEVVQLSVLLVVPGQSFERAPMPSFSREQAPLGTVRDLQRPPRT
jgi:hypothetical protein